jgi:hypothetical protein
MPAVRSAFSDRVLHYASESLIDTTDSTLVFPSRQGYAPIIRFFSTFNATFKLDSYCTDLLAQTPAVFSTNDSLVYHIYSPVDHIDAPLQLERKLVPVK